MVRVEAIKDEDDERGEEEVGSSGKTLIYHVIIDS